MNSPTTTPATAASLNSDSFGQYVAARLLEFCADTTPWPRRLWDLGSVLALREVLEAGEWIDAQVLSEAAVTWLCRTLERVLLGRDRGLGESEVRRQLREVLHADLSQHSRHRRRLSELIELVDDGYLQRWVQAADSAQGVSPERLSRAVATHLLDRGYSMGFLHRTFRSLRDGSGTVGDLLAAAEKLASATPRQYEVFVPFGVVPHQELAQSLPEWRSGTSARNWLAKHAPGESVRQVGAFLYSINALDPYAAARAAGELVDPLIARSTYMRRRRSGLEPVGRLWVSGHSEWLPLRAPARGVDVLSLQREGTLYKLHEHDLIDDALELAAPLNSASAGPAVAGGWAALESLLYHPGDPADRKEGRAIAATRFAALVVCSWPRAELTTLSFRHEPASPDLLAHQLKRATTNRERAQAVAGAIQAGRAIETRSPEDSAGAARMNSMIQSPRTTLQDVRVVIEGNLRRLYRQRNIVLHGGSTQAVALTATLRTAAPLVGAGLDRMAHSYLVDGITPLRLTAKAEVRLGLVGVPGAPSVTDLLA